VLKTFYKYSLKYKRNFNISSQRNLLLFKEDLEIFSLKLSRIPFFFENFGKVKHILWDQVVRSETLIYGLSNYFIIKAIDDFTKKRTGLILT